MGLCLQTRSVGQAARAMPGAAAPVLIRLNDMEETPVFDQLTVNEYPPGVGLAPHVDTHSAFTG